ncbi:DUF1759 and Peptidase A17 and DUF1758 and RVT 1 d omain containing protein [Elysia marginata]|uniref:DUF1759 and Peptidase A17 and DUF1758 and RVT 1 d omain containing protein n=1 Tax=Elysia marginata TaxID=1093978 RepID=A0AAV4GXC4_9GAST|nr:DUF1759 and Peptidase A17 and DUF1758 and RVT 1 d omain containing protein [Elysia marginata]
MANAEQCKVSLVISKTRVAPIKKMTLPRQELMGALLVARLLVFVRNALRLPMDTSYCCFTDSNIVLGWIKADPSKWKQFVGIESVKFRISPTLPTGLIVQEGTILLTC